MKSDKLFLSLFVVLFLSQIAMADTTVTRTLSKNYTISNTSDNITVTISSNGGGFQFYGIVETIPLNMNVVLLSSNVAMNRSDDGLNYTFIGLENLSLSSLKYNISANISTPKGFYNISGYFVNSDLTNGTITPNTTQFRVVDNIIIAYDTDGNGLQKSEAISAVIDYFSYRLSFDDVIIVIRTYLKL